MFKQIQYAKSNNKLGWGIVGVLEPKNFGSIPFYELELIIKALVVVVIAVLFVLRISLGVYELHPITSLLYEIRTH